MVTSLEIENFKGIAARQRIEFAPLTLLFGANSAGKSSILQALLYLHELIERGAADVDRAELGGNVLELGGFARLFYLDKSQCDRVNAEQARLDSVPREVGELRVLREVFEPDPGCTSDYFEPEGAA